MKENLLQIIGNRIEKRKEEKKNTKERYWKLSPVERIDYDSKFNYIGNDSYVPLSGTWIYLKVMIGLPIFLLVLSFFLSFELLPLMYNASKELIILLLRFFPMVLLFEIIMLILTTNCEEKQLKELNKRFKLQK